jgi:hypothetical protein
MADGMTGGTFFAAADYAADIASLPDGVEALSRVIQGLLVHGDWLGVYGLADVPGSRVTLPVSDRLHQILAADPRPLAEPRPIAQRTHATCRDYALLLVSFLRGKGHATRLRCGFADYLKGNSWEDHWICEYRDSAEGTWHFADAQLDAVLLRELAIDFDPARLPTGRFRSAGEIWTDCRNGACDPLSCGHGAATGLWFIAVNVVRDQLALSGQVTSDWDNWRMDRDPVGAFEKADISLFDAIARAPMQRHAELRPFWLLSGK